MSDWGDRDVVVIHEMGARSHYYAISSVSGCNISWLEFSCFKLLIKGVIKRDSALIKKQALNFFHLVTLYCFVKNKVVILGVAPYDWRVILFHFLIENNKVIYHTSWPYWGGLQVPKRWAGVVFRWYWKSFLNRVYAIACVTKTSRLGVVAFSGRKDSDVKVVSHAIDSVFFSTPTSVLAREFDFIYVGRVAESKGVYEIVELSKRLPECKFLVVGELRCQIDFSKYENISYLPYVSSRFELSKLYNMSNYFLLPSKAGRAWEELFGIALIESMGCGCIPMATSNVGPSEIITDFTNGFLFSEKDFISCANRVYSKLSVDAKTRERISLSARETSRLYSAENVREVWEEFLG